MTGTIQQSGFQRLAPLLRRLTGDEKHALSAESTIDVIWVLYDRVLRVDPARPETDERDRFLVSKGHGPHAYYAVLAAKGFFPLSWLDNLAGPGSPLGHRPDRTLVPGGVFTVHGWTATRAASHDHDELERALRGHTAGRAHLVIADMARGR